MNLFMWNMKPHIFRNGGKNISNGIMKYNLVPTMGIIEKVGPC
jgi:hypothetical protein